MPWYWLRVPYYDPLLRRFLQPDPSALDGARSYVYCHNDPADCADPIGLAGGLGLGDGDRIDGPVGGLGPRDQVATARAAANQAFEAGQTSDVSVVVAPNGEILPDATGSYDPSAFDRQAAVVEAQSNQSYLDPLQDFLDSGNRVATATKEGLSDINGWATNVNGVPRVELGFEPANHLGVLDAAREVGLDGDSPML